MNVKTAVTAVTLTLALTSIPLSAQQYPQDQPSQPEIQRQDQSTQQETERQDQTQPGATTEQRDTSVGTSGADDPNALPGTATFLPLAGLIGLGTLAAGLALRRFRK